MALKDKLHALDHSFFPGTRDDEEDAETFLRRVAASRAISPAQAGDVMTALREYFGVEPQAGNVKEESGGEKDESGGEKDESGGEKDESEEKDDSED